MRNLRHSKGTKYVYKPDVGVKTDFESLLQKFVASGTVRYDAFSKIWREMKMFFYCAGRQTQREAREYVEDCFRIAIQFCVPPSSFLVRAGAVYLLYGLYHFQLVTPRVRIRLTPQCWEAMLAFIQEARDQQHLDLDYIFQSLVVDRAFVFTASVIWNYPSMKEAEDMTIISENLKENCNAVDEIFSSSGLNQLALIHDQYHKMKVVLNGEESTKPDTSLDIIHQDFINGIYKTLSAHRDKQISIKQGVSYRKNRPELEGGQESTDGEEKMSHKKGLKKKAYETFKGSKANKDDSEPQKPTSLITKNMRRKVYPILHPQGRYEHIMLYEKDETGSLTENTDFMKEVMNISEEDAVVYKSTESSGSEREHTSDRGKAPVMGQGKKRGRKSRRERNKCTDEDVDKSVKSIYDAMKKRSSKVEIDLLSDSDKNEMKSPTKRKRTSKYQELASDVNTDTGNDESFKGTATEIENDTTKVTEDMPKDKVKVKKEILSEYDLEISEAEMKSDVKSSKGKSKTKVTSFKTKGQTGSSDSGKHTVTQGPTAQQKLHKKLADRAKQTRLSKQSKKKN